MIDKYFRLDLSKVNILRAFMVGIFAVSVLGLTSPVRTLTHQPETNMLLPTEQSGATVYQRFEFVELTKSPNYTMPLVAVAVLSLFGVVLSYLKLGEKIENGRASNKRKRNYARICRSLKDNIE